MPIRFRCPYCNQLLGIARRKAGTVVECPACHGHVAVPAVEPPPLPAPAISAEAPAEAAGPFDVELVAPPPLPAPNIAHPPPAGIVLSRPRLLLLTAGLLALLALTFVAGLLLGRFLL
jgi:hypothetical protein